MFFTEWNPELHITEPFEIPEHWPRWIAVDYGFAAPWCCLWLARDPETRVVYVYRERYQAGLRDEEQARIIKAESGDERIVARVLDPSMFNARTEQNRPSIAQVYADIIGAEVMPGHNNRRTGWAVVRRVLASADSGPRLKIFRNAAPNLERTMPAMVHDPLDPEDVADKLHGSKTEDHAPDALRYGLSVEASPHRDETVSEIRWAA
jgi:hypothetical protein